MSNDLEEWFFKNDGRLCLKMVHYFGVYERHFSKYRNRAATFVEIGVQAGGSLDMWRAYLGPQARIIGVDIQEKCRSLAGPNTDILIGDQGDPAFLRELLGFAGRIDVLLDDGGHTMGQQITTFETCFPALAPDGVYACEDLHTSYWEGYGGGLRRPGTFIELMKQKVDELNGWHHRPVDVSAFTESAASICFYDSIVVIEKAVRHKPKSFQSGKGGAGSVYI